MIGGREVADRGAALERAYRRFGSRYPSLALIVIFQTAFIVVAVAVGVVALYVHVSAEKYLLLFGAAAALQVGYNLRLAQTIRRETAPIASWIEAGRPAAAAVEAWNAAAGLPVRILRQELSLRDLPGILTWIFVPGWCAFAVWQLSLPAYAIPLLLAAAALTFMFYAEALRFFLSEIALRPVVADIARCVPPGTDLDPFRISLRWRQLLVLPTINVVAGVIVAGIVGGGSASFGTFAVAIGGAVLVASTISLTLTTLLSNSISGPIVALRSAAERVGEGDFSVQVPVVTTDETGALSQAFNSMTAGLAERERIREAFGTYVDREVAEHILSEGTSLAGEEVEVTMMFLDIRNFTGFAERSTAQEVVAAVNRLFERVVPIIHDHGGHVDKFVGDGLLAVFGAPRRQDDHADQALAAAIEMAAAVEEEFGGELGVGIGLNSGRVVAGNVGGAGRLEFSVIGDPVNVAARVESATRKTGDVVLLSEHTRALLRRGEVQLERRPEVPLKGKREVVDLYAPAVRAPARG